jgi:predicted amidohydrolase
MQREPKSIADSQDGTLVSSIRRRRFCKWLAASALLAGRRPIFASSATADSDSGGAETRKVAAIQMEPQLGAVDANLTQAEQLVREAAAKQAQLIVLPEMFTSAAAFHEDIIKAIRPLDGKPAQLLKDLARQENTVVGGSFLAEDQGRVFNTFLLVMPDGTTVRHDKDLPTYWETCYYEKGNDDGVLPTPLGPLGTALCWEMIRSGTARRLQGNVQLLLAGSTWWTLPEEAGPDHPLRAVNLQMLMEAPPRLARVLGVPVVHASHAGPFVGFESPELPDVPYRSVYLGEAMITDASGNVLARRSLEDGAGVVTTDVTVGPNATPSEAIPERFWLPEQMPQEWIDSWDRWFARGEDYYQTVTLPYLASGEIAEYVPPYMR